MGIKITSALKVLAASAMLMTAIASPSLAQSDWEGAQSVGSYHGYYQNNNQSNAYWAHRQDWDH